MKSCFVLLVEDEGPKRAHIRAFLNDNFLHMEVIEARSLTSALDALDENSFDLILLDMSLPTFDVCEGEGGGRPHGFGGIEVLRHLEMSGLLIETIVVTGYEAFPGEDGVIIDIETMRSRLKDEFPVMLRDVVHFNSGLEQWKNVLKSEIENFITGCRND